MAMKYNVNCDILQQWIACKQEDRPEREYLAGDEGRRGGDEEHAEPGDLTVVLCREIWEESISIISLKEQNNVCYKVSL